MKCKPIRDVLTRQEITRLRQLLELEQGKPENENKAVFHHINTIPSITAFDWYRDILYFIRSYRRRIDVSIKTKLRAEFDNRIFDMKKFEEDNSPQFYKYRKSDWRHFYDRAIYFLLKYKDPFNNFFGVSEEDYLNRAYLGMGFEFLLKAIYLKKGFLINKYERKITSPDSTSIRPKYLSETNSIARLRASNLLDSTNNIVEDLIPISLLSKKFLKTPTNEYRYFIKHLEKLRPHQIKIDDFNYAIIAGLKLAQKWRNVDVHTPRHNQYLDGNMERHLKMSYYEIHRMFFKGLEIPRFPNTTSN